MARTPKTTKGEAIPADLLAMTLKELETLDEGFDLRSEKAQAEWKRLLMAREECQLAIENFRQRGRDITSAILAKLGEQLKGGK